MKHFIKTWLRKLGLIKPLEIKNPSKHRINYAKVCPSVGNTLMVSSSGDITFCCFDESLENKIGNLKTMRLKDALQSKKVHDVIISQLTQNYKTMPKKCKNCLFYKQYLKDGN